jgi:hypothetical protein
VDCWSLGGGDSVVAASKKMEKAVGGGSFCSSAGKGTVKWLSNVVLPLVVGDVWAALQAQASLLNLQ